MTFQLVLQCLNQLHHLMSQTVTSRKLINTAKLYKNQYFCEHNSEECLLQLYLQSFFVFLFPI